MTWALAETAQLFAACIGVRSSLKRLKRLANSDPASELSSLEEVLMFWVIYGVYMIFEQHFEFLISWVPCYYYFKASFILVVAFPRLKFTRLIFSRGLVPFIEECNSLLESYGGLPSLKELALSLPFLLVGLAFPFLAGPVNSNMETISLSQTKTESIDSCLTASSIMTTTESPGLFTLPSSPQTVRSSSKRFSTDSAPFSPSPSRKLVLSETVQQSFRDSSRRLSSLRCLIGNQQKSDDEVETKKKSQTCSGSRNDGNGKENVDLSFRPSYGSRRTELTSLRGLGGSSGSGRVRGSGSAEVTPEKTIKDFRSPQLSPGLMGSLRGLFSLDIHSPPINSQERDQRRKTLMALGRGRSGSIKGGIDPKPRTPHEAMPSHNYRISAESCIQQGASLPPLEEALNDGKVSFGRGRKRR